MGGGVGGGGRGGGGSGDIIIPKVSKQELWFMSSARRLMDL